MGLGCGEVRVQRVVPLGDEPTGRWDSEIGFGVLLSVGKILHVRRIFELVYWQLVLPGGRFHGRNGSFHVGVLFLFFVSLISFNGVDTRRLLLGKRWSGRKSVSRRSGLGGGSLGAWAVSPIMAGHSALIAHGRGWWSGGSGTRWLGQALRSEGVGPEAFGRSRAALVGGHCLQGSEEDVFVLFGAGAVVFLAIHEYKGSFLIGDVEGFMEGGRLPPTDVVLNLSVSNSLDELLNQVGGRRVDHVRIS